MFSGPENRHRHTCTFEGGPRHRLSGLEGLVGPERPHSQRFSRASLQCGSDLGLRVCISEALGVLLLGVLLLGSQFEDGD